MQKTRSMVALADLRDAPHNPPNRITPKNIRTLADSMELLGLLQPITIGLDRQIIEGHRRVASARQLGWTEIEANIVKEADANAIYGSLNTTARKLSGCDALYVWLETPQAVVPSVQKSFAEMTDLLGRPLVKRMCKAGFSRRVFLTARRIARYCESDDSETLQQVVEWLLTFPVAGQVMKAIEAGESPRTILNAVRSGKTIRLKLAVG